MQDTNQSGCDILKLFGFWSDIFNLILGVGVLSNGNITAGIGYILTHLASILYLVFHQKLGVQYHEIATRSMMIIPEVFCIIHSLIRDAGPPRYFARGLILLGFAWSIISASFSIMNHCCAQRSRIPPTANSKTVRNKSKNITQIIII